MKITDEDFIELIDKIKNNSITMIDLGKNNIGTEGAIALAEAIKVNTSITEIYLGNNHIGNKEAIVLAEALKINTSITEKFLKSIKALNVEKNLMEKCKLFCKKINKILNNWAAIKKQ